MELKKQYRLPFGLACILVGAILRRHSYLSPMTTSTPAEQTSGAFLFFFFGPLMCLWALFDFPKPWRRF
jgi:hypothetical protein